MKDIDLCFLTIILQHGIDGSLCGREIGYLLAQEEGLLRA